MPGRTTPKEEVVVVGAVMRMDFCDQKMRQQASISVGDAHHFVKSDMLTRWPSGSPMADLLKVLRKGTRILTISLIPFQQSNQFRSKSDQNPINIRSKRNFNASKSNVTFPMLDIRFWVFASRFENSRFHT